MAELVELLDVIPPPTWSSLPGARNGEVHTLLREAGQQFRDILRAHKEQQLRQCEELSKLLMNAMVRLTRNVEALEDAEPELPEVHTLTAVVPAAETSSVSDPSVPHVVSDSSAVSQLRKQKDNTVSKQSTERRASYRKKMLSKARLVRMYDQEFGQIQPVFVAQLETIKKETEARSQRRLRFDGLLKFVSGSWFTGVIALMICINAVTICVNTDLEMAKALWEYQNDGTYDLATFWHIFWVIDLCFAVIFGVEASLRLLALECTFFTAQDGLWNILDLVLAVVSTVEMAAVGAGLDLSYIRILRLVRISRTLRVVRTVPLFMKLRIMISAIANSVLSLLWALGLLFFTMLMFSAILLQGATLYVTTERYSSSPRVLDNVEFLQEYFCSVPMAVLTLYMSITGGVNWYESCKVMLDIGPAYGALFMLFIAIMVFALLNIVTGIFVNDAVEMAQMDKDVMMRIERARKRELMHSLKEVFDQLDEGSGMVTYEDFTRLLEEPELVHIFAHLGLEVTEAVDLFEALDVDENKELEVQEFVVGCMQLRGQAKTVDVVIQMRQTRRILTQLKESLQLQQKELLNLSQMVADVADARHRL